MFLAMFAEKSAVFSVLHGKGVEIRDAAGRAISSGHEKTRRSFSALCRGEILGREESIPAIRSSDLFQPMRNAVIPELAPVQTEAQLVEEGLRNIPVAGDLIQ